MPIDVLYDLGALNFLGGGAFRLDGIEDAQIDPAISEHLQAAAGATDNSWVGVMNQTPMISGSFTEIAKALTNISGLTGLAVSAAGSITSLEAYLTQMADLGLTTSGSNHMKVAVNKALVIPETLTVPSNGPATLSLSIHALDDGTNPVFTYTVGTALPAAATLTEQFTLGPCNINGTAINAVTSWSYNFGLQVMKKWADGKVFPNYATVRPRSPMLTVNTEDPRLLSTLGLSGAAQGGTASTFYARKMAKQGTRVADGTAEHVKITVTASQGMILPGSFGGANQSPRAGSVRIVPIAGASAFATISAASAIT